MKDGWDPDLPSNLDAAVTWNGRNYFFKGCSAYAYDQSSNKIAWQNDIRTNWNTPCNIDAASRWGNYVYLFKGRSVFKWKYDEAKFIAGPYDISSFDSKVEEDLDAGFKWSYNDVTYLMKGEKYWRIDQNGNTQEGVTRGGFKGLFESDLLPYCGCDCTVKAEGNWEFDSIKYHIEEGQFHLHPPTEVAKKVIDNRKSSTTPSIEFTVSKAVTETESFTHTAGMSMTVGTEFKVGVPLIAEGKISVSVTASYEFQYGKERSVTKTKEAKFTCPAAVGKITTCLATYRIQQIDVPYTMTLRNKKKYKCTCTSEGVYRGVSATHMSMTVNETA